MTQHWLLQCNPTRWRIYDFFEAGHELTSWTVTRHVHRVNAGDRFALWVSGRLGGVVAFGDVTGPACAIAGSGDAVDDEHWTDQAVPQRERWLLPIAVTHTFLHDPIARDVLADDVRFADSAMLRQP